MVDPIAIIGTAGALANIIDILVKTINTVAELRSQWKDADLEVLNLESQLAALNAALSKIKAWAEASSEDPHHQLVIDLDRCVFCCRLLISRIHSEVSQFTTTAENELDASSKLRLLLKTKEFSNIQRMIEQQTGALTLLLTACNVAALPDQKNFLHQSETREVFNKMESDTESLYVHRDVDSLFTSNTETTITSSKRSLQFDFDPDLFISQIYQRWIRGSIKRGLHEQQSEVPYFLRPSTRTHAIDRHLEVEGKKLRHAFKLLLLGDRSRINIMRMMQSDLENSRSAEELSRYKPEIYKALCKFAKSVVSAMQDLEISPTPDGIWDHANIVESFRYEPDHSTSSDLDPSFKTALRAILESPYYSKVKARSTKVNLPHAAEHFFREIDRVTSTDYEPTELDIRWFDTLSSGIIETWFEIGQIQLRILDISQQKSTRKKWIHLFEDLTSIIYVVNLDAYDQIPPGDDERLNSILESLYVFSSIVKSKWFAESSIILILTGYSKFTEKLEHDGLENYLPEYTGGAGSIKAVKYIIWRFHKLNRSHKDIYPCMIELDDMDSAAELIQFVYKALSATRVGIEIRKTGLLQKPREHVS